VPASHLIVSALVRRDGHLLLAEWVPLETALGRLACVAWYDCVPITRYLAGEARPGATYPQADA
jgi:hypothetical protein